jgi:ABC-type glutathione transport system ATPase component
VPGRRASRCKRNLKAFIVDDGAFKPRGARLTDRDKIAIRRLSKSYDLGGEEVKALESFDLEIGEGEFVCILGPSGCGKTTLLRILAGLETPSQG